MKAGTCENISVSDATYQELKKVLCYFAKRTNGDLVSGGVNSAYCDLVKREVHEYFTRAVVYLLYGDPDAMMSSNPIPFSSPNVFAWSEPNKSTPTAGCSFCSKVGNLKTCKQCGEAQYCDKDCQSKHWRKHKVHCKKSAKANKQESS